MALAKEKEEPIRAPIAETDEEKVSSTSEEDDTPSYRPRKKLPSNGLSDQSKVSGFTWGELRPMLQEKNARLNAFINGLTKEERSLLERLDAA